MSTGARPKQIKSKGEEKKCCSVKVATKQKLLKVTSFTHELRRKKQTLYRETK